MVKLQKRTIATPKQVHGGKVRAAPKSMHGSKNVLQLKYYFKQDSTFQKYLYTFFNSLRTHRCSGYIEIFFVSIGTRYNVGTRFSDWCTKHVFGRVASHFLELAHQNQQAKSFLQWTQPIAKSLKIWVQNEAVCSHDSTSMMLLLNHSISSIYDRWLMFCCETSSLWPIWTRPNHFLMRIQPKIWKHLNKSRIHLKQFAAMTSHISQPFFVFSTNGDSKAFWGHCPQRNCLKYEIWEMQSL